VDYECYDLIDRKRRKSEKRHAAERGKNGKVPNTVGRVRDITGHSTRKQTLRSDKDYLPAAVLVGRLGLWEYNVERNLFEFDDGFYAIYGTNVAREGSFMAPDVYVREFVHPNDARIAETEMLKARCFAGHHYAGRFEHRIIRRDGEVRTIMVWVNVIRDAAGKIAKWYGANQDITGQKAMEEALRISGKKLSLAAELARLGPWEFNFEKNLFDFNDEFYALYGTNVAREGRFMTPDVYLREFVHPDDAWMVEAEEDTILSFTGRCYENQFKHRIIRRDGGVRTIIVRVNVIRNIAGKIVRWFGANQDITDQTLAELALRASEERLKVTLHALPDMLYRVNIEGKLLDCHIPDQYRHYLIKKIDQYDALADILPVQLALRTKIIAVSAIKTGETQMAEYIGQINNKECFLELRAVAINENEALVIFQDQTELFRSRKEFRRLDKLDLIGKMAAGIAHEVRNPLTTVRGYLQYLSGKEQFACHVETFSMMIDELDRTNAIISEFLALSKNKAVRLEAKNLHSIIMAIYPLLKVDAIAENKSVSLELADHIPQVIVDESEIRQLIINLVRNGLEAVAGKGVVTIKTTRDERHVILIIRDNGTGIPADIIEQIGTPFMTTKDFGTGLGLSVCYSIAARHHAKIDFKTDKDGTEFTVRFKPA
jgi:PAS domain S-box-containing protein